MKKIKDVTVSEILGFCKKNKCKCRNSETEKLCEMYSICNDMLTEIDKSIFEQEVEIPNEPVGNSDQLSEKQIKLNVTKDISEMVRNERQYRLEVCAKDSFEYAYSKGMSDALEWVEKVLRKY